MTFEYEPFVPSKDKILKPIVNDPVVTVPADSLLKQIGLSFPGFFSSFLTIGIIGTLLAWLYCRCCRAPWGGSEAAMPRTQSFRPPFQPEQGLLGPLCCTGRHEDTREHAQDHYQPVRRAQTNLPLHSLDHVTVVMPNMTSSTCQLTPSSDMETQETSA